MRYKAKVDTNQQQIVSALRKLGASVYSTAQMGNGFADIVVGYRGKNYLFEIKSSPKSSLTSHEQNFMLCWSGQYNVICSVDEALKILSK